MSSMISRHELSSFSNSWWWISPTHSIVFTSPRVVYYVSWIFMDSKHSHFKKSNPFPQSTENMEQLLQKHQTIAMNYTKKCRIQHSTAGHGFTFGDGLSGQLGRRPEATREGTHRSNNMDKIWENMEHMVSWCFFSSFFSSFSFNHDLFKNLQRHFGKVQHFGQTFCKVGNPTFSRLATDSSDLSRLAKQLAGPGNVATSLRQV